jgi:hypothetical protein
MENQQIEFYTKPGENIIEECMKNRKRTYNQFVNYKETFKAGLRNIEDQFITPYETYLNNFSNKLNDYDALIEKNIESTNIKTKCHSEINTLLADLLAEKTRKYRDYINEIKKCTDKFINEFVTMNFSKGDELIEKMIQEQKEEKKREKEEMEKRKKIEEENRKLMEEQKKFDNFLKDKKKLKIEINGKEEEEANIKGLENAANFNYEKIILKEMSKERFELIFSQSFSINGKLRNKDDNNDIFSDVNQRVNPIQSVSGEPAPGVMSQINNITKNMVENNIDENNNKKITDIIILDSDLEDIDFANYFPNIDNLEIIDTKISYSLSKKVNFSKINSLKLEGVGLINENFNDLFEQIRKNEIMRQNIRVLSVKNNYISFLDYKKGYADNILKTMTFNNLEILDMSYNKLILFQNQIFNSLESIKVIDLTYNNIAFPTNLADLLKSAKTKKCLVLMTNNLAILKENVNIEYNKYLVDIFPHIRYPLENITLDNIFCNNNFKDIFNLEIRQFKDSLEYLNLSNGQLKDSDLIPLLNEKWVFHNLKYFILNANYLTEKFIYSLIAEEYNFFHKFSNLKVLKLSDNKINCSDVGKFKQFLEMYKNLEILELKNTPAENNINQFLRKKVMKYHDTNNSKKSLHAYNEDEKKIEQIFDDEHIKEKTKITIKINDLIFSKYTGEVWKNFPYFFDRINLENQFPNQ